MASDLPGVLPDTEAPTNPGSAIMPEGPLSGPAASATSGLVNALGHAAGYATRDPQLEQQADARQALQEKMSYMAPLGLAHAAVTKAIASGDLDAANAVYQK